MKTLVTLTATTIAIIAQMCLIGLNGLTLISIPITLYLGIEVADRLTDKSTRTE